MRREEKFEYREKIKKKLSKYLTKGIQWLYICSGNKRREFKEIRETKEIKEVKEFKEVKEVKEFKEIKEIEEVKEFKEIEEIEDCPF